MFLLVLFNLDWGCYFCNCLTVFHHGSFQYMAIFTVVMTTKHDRHLSTYMRSFFTQIVLISRSNSVKETYFSFYSKVIIHSSIQLCMCLSILLYNLHVFNHSFFHSFILSFKKVVFWLDISVSVTTWLVHPIKPWFKIKCLSVQCHVQSPVSGVLFSQCFWVR